MYVKIINTNLYPQIDKHHNYGQYPYNLPKNDNKALNTIEYNNETFDPKSGCGPGALYFTEIKNVFHFIRYGNTVCIVELAKDSKVVIVNEEHTIKKYKTNKLYIVRTMELWDIDTIRYLIDNGAKSWDPILNEACEYNYIDIVQYLIDNEYVDDLFVGSVIRVAADQNHFEILHCLTNYIMNKYPSMLTCPLPRMIQMSKSNLQYSLITSYTAALTYAAKRGHFKITQYLMEFTNPTFIYGMNDIHWALCMSLKKGDLQTVQYLINHNAYHHTKDDYALHIAFESSIQELATYLIQHIITKMDYESHIFTIITLACKHNRFDILLYLIDQGIDVCEEKDWILTYATKYNHLEIVQFITKFNPCNVKDALCEAAAYGYLEIVQYLLNNNNDITIDDSVLFRAIKQNHYGIFKAVCEYKRVFDKPKTLNIAIKQKRYKIVEYLLRLR